MPFYKIDYNVQKIDQIRDNQQCVFPQGAIICAENENKAGEYACKQIHTSNNLGDERDTKTGRMELKGNDICKLILIEENQIEAQIGHPHNHEGDSDSCNPTMCIRTGETIKLPRE